MNEQKCIALDNYHIVIGSAREYLTPLINTGVPSRQVVCLVDQNTEVFCLPVFIEIFGHEPEVIISVPAGEQHKNIDTCQYIWSKLLDHNIDRRALMVNLGGGVIGDMGGFCAGTYKRGIDFVQIPTTLLSMVDASIGGKLGIDFASLKNVIGLFRNPEAVLIEPSFLDTLPKRQLINGFAETIKHALIGDSELWQNIRTLKDVDVSTAVSTLPPSLMVKKSIVLQDPHEMGARKALNFGHTIGHAIESHALQQGIDLLHGEAIVLGMVAEAFLSTRRGMLDERSFAEIVKTLHGLYPKLPKVDVTDSDQIIRYMSNDKKNVGEKVNCTMLQSIGQFEVDKWLTKQEICAALQSIDTYYYNHSISNE